MRYALVLALAACSSKSSAPPPPAPGSGGSAGSAAPRAPARPPIPRPTMKASPPIDLTAAGITGVRVMPVVAMADGSASAEKGVFDVEWHAPSRHATGVVCRIESYNLATFGAPDLDDGAARGDHEVLYRPDPFVLDPKVCEVRFLDARHDVVARACYQDGLNSTMTEGPCPAGTFPPPKLPAGMAVDVQGASAHRTGANGLQVKALVTIGQPLASEASFAITCDGVASKPAPGEGAVPLSRLAAGETLYTWKLVFAMTQPLPADPTQCELRVFTKTNTLGTFCLSEGSTEPGRCSAH